MLKRRLFNSKKTRPAPQRTIVEVELELNVAREVTREMEKNDPYLGMDDKANSWDLYRAYMKPYWEKQQKLDRELRLLMTPEFTRDVKESDHVMSLEEFIETCNDGCFIDYDGFGHYVRDGKMSNIDIYPSDVEHKSIRKDFDTIVWFNK